MRVVKNRISLPETADDADRDRSVVHHQQSYDDDRRICPWTWQRTFLFRKCQWRLFPFHTHSFSIFSSIISRWCQAIQVRNSLSSMTMRLWCVHTLDSPSAMAGQLSSLSYRWNVGRPRCYLSRPYKRQRFYSGKKKRNIKSMSRWWATFERAHWLKYTII